MREGIHNLPTRAAVEVVVHAPATEVRSRVGPWATIEEAGDDRCVLRMSSESLDWPMMALGVIGAEFEVVGPAQLTDHLRERIGRFARAVGRRQGGGSV